MQSLLQKSLSPDLEQFTKRYLCTKNRGDVWEETLKYNDAVVGGIDSWHRSTLGRRGKIFITEKRMNFFKTWRELDYDADDVARAAKRLESQLPWKKWYIQNFILKALAEELDFEFTEKSGSHILAVIQGFYDGAYQNLKKVRIT